MVAKDDSSDSPEWSDAVCFFIGVGLAVGSTIFNGISFIIKKKALLHAAINGSSRASAGGFGYLKEWMWWIGLTTMGIGELANFAAYAFTPASVVTPLGALSILVTAVLASVFLNEELNLLGKIGCFLCILGSIIIVIHAPQETEIDGLTELLNKVKETSFVIYLIAILCICLFCGCFLGPRYGNETVLVYITVCSFSGSLTVTGCKGVALCIHEAFEGNLENWKHWQPWILLVMVVVCICIQMIYLNKALDAFNTGIVTPVYYVMFTTMVLIASAILFKEWKCLDAKDIVSNICGFLVIVTAVILLNSFKENNVSCDMLRIKWNQKLETEYTTGTIDDLNIRPSNRQLHRHSAF